MFLKFLVVLIRLTYSGAHLSDGLVWWFSNLLRWKGVYQLYPQSQIHSLKPQNDRYDDESFCFWVILTSVLYSGKNHTCIVHLSNVMVPEKLRIAPSIWGSKDLMSSTAIASGTNLISTSWWNVCWSGSKFLHVVLIVQCGVVARGRHECIYLKDTAVPKKVNGGTCSWNWFVSKLE